MKSKTMKVVGILVLLFGLSILAGCSRQSATTSMAVGSVGEKVDKKITVFKSPDCGCCVGYIAALEKDGFDVNVVKTTDMARIKEKYHVPGNMRSCHTAVMGDYFIEGHVPIKAVEKLLSEKPQIDGIMLPGMPPGSTGMPGVKRGPFKVYALADGEISEFMTI